MQIKYHIWILFQVLRENSNYYFQNNIFIKLTYKRLIKGPFSYFTNFTTQTIVIKRKNIKKIVELTFILLYSEFIKFKLLLLKELIIIKKFK